MQERIARTRSLFYFGLCLMLATAILSATTGSAGSMLLTVLTIAGAGLALAAKLRAAQLQRNIRRRQPRFGTWATP